MVEREIIFEAPIEKVFQVISDFESYPKFLTSTESAVSRQTPRGEEVDFEINLIKPVRYTIRVSKKAPHELSWDFVSGEMMKKNSGSWKLKDLGDGRTQALYSVDVGFGWMVPKMVVDQLTKIQLPLMLEAFQKRVCDV